MVRGVIFIGLKITTNGDGSPEIKRRLLLGRKVMANLNNIPNNIDITLSTNPWYVVVYGRQS